MTSSPAWMPLYVADYLADTGHLSAAEHGAYMLLIMHYWRQGFLPADEASLSRIARMTAREWSRSRDTIAALFDAEWKPRFRTHFEHPFYRYVQRDIRERVLLEAEGACHYCGQSSPRLEIDHVLPVARGGSNEYENLVAACRGCNASKGARTPSDWRGRH